MLLRHMLSDITDEITVLAECDDLPNGIKAIKKHKPDIVFLDIEMPGRSGLEILDYFEDEEVNFDIVFTTGYSDYAIQAFKLSATDYLLKPINPDTLSRTVEKLLKKYNKDKIVEFKALKENLNSSSLENGERCLVVNLMSSARFIKLKDLTLLKAEGSYCELYLKSGEKLLASKNLKHFEDKLSDIPLFFRSHKSYIINLRFVTEFNKHDNVVLMEGNVSAQVSSDKVDSFFEKMELLS